MSQVLEPGVLSALSPLLREAKSHAVVLSDGESELGALVSMEDYELVRKAKVESFLKSAAEFGEHLRTRARDEGISDDELLRMLDRKAS